jgi:hypothetical protein
MSLEYMRVKEKKSFSYITFVPNLYANIVKQFKSEVDMDTRVLAP